jgi:hypothetical protein
MARDTTRTAQRVMEHARRLLDECGIQRPPVNLVRIARHLDLRRIRELDVRLDGQLIERPVVRSARRTLRIAERLDAAAPS